VASGVRDGIHQGSAHSLVTSSRRALGSGLALAVLYVAAAALSGHLSPLARRPVLDGLAPPAAYRWISPPPDLASGNQQPAAGQFTIQINPGTGSAPGVFNTNDLQAALILPDGAIADHTGQESVLLTVTPLDPSQFGPAPAGMAISGNVYRFELAYQPSGEAVGKLLKSGQVLLFYPSVPAITTTDHTILTSQDGQAWAAAQSIDTIGQQQTVASVDGFGYFAVGVAAEAAAKASRNSWTRLIPSLLIAGLVAIVILLIARYEVRARRASRRGRKRRRR
jgi:hypothetical protein